MTGDATGDQLGAAAAVATMTAILYALWFPEIRQVLATERQLNRKSREPAIVETSQAIRSKAVPLVVISLIPVAVFAIDVLGVVQRAAHEVGLRGVSADLYDSSQAALLALYGVSVALAWLAVGLLRALLRQRSDFSASDRPLSQPK